MRERKQKEKVTVAVVEESAFQYVLDLILNAKGRAEQTVNAELIGLYWNIGKYVSTKINKDGWGKGTVSQLSEYIRHRQPGIRGYSSQNIWRMRQFFETYKGEKKLSTALRGIPWSGHLHIISGSRSPEEREFYLRVAAENRWPVRELERQMESGLYEKALLNPPKLSTALREMHPSAESCFKDSYSLEFLGLPDLHDEGDLHRALLRNLSQFLTELGRDFCFIGSEVPLQVGGQDFALDLLFFHRELNSLVAIELKAVRFMPEHLGKLEFYLEALDRDVRKPHENPAIGILLCATKDSEVVEYALSRSLSPAMVAQYRTSLPDKKLLQGKLHEFYRLLSEHAKGEQP